MDQNVDLKVTGENLMANIGDQALPLKCLSEDFSPQFGKTLELMESQKTRMENIEGD